MDTSWKNEAVETALRSFIPAFTASMDARDVEQARQTYSILFRRDLDHLGELNRNMAQSIFTDQVRKRTQRTATLPLQERQKILSEDAFLSRVAPLSDKLEGIGERVLRGEALSPSERATVEAHRAELNALAKESRSRAHMSSTADELISEALLDCRFILEGGEPTSFRLRKFADFMSEHNTR